MKLSAIAIICFSVTVSVFLLATKTDPVPTKPIIAPLDISDYSTWKEVTLTRPYIDGSWAVMCMPALRTELMTNHATPKTLEFKSELGTQQIADRGYVAIFVNPIGEQAFLTQKNPVFPEGTVIVKARRDDIFNGPPIFLTVMRKLTAGSSPKTGDWQYIVYAPDAKTELKDHNLPDCKSCHAKWQSTDFVSREYLNKDQLALLK